MRTLAQPGVDRGSEWLNMPTRIRHDPHSNSLFTMEWRDAAIREFTTSGDYVRTYGGRKGEGPGEIENLGTFTITEAFVAVLDLGQNKILLFDRRGGSLRRELRLNRRLVADISFVGDTALALIPGSDTGAFDLIDLEGNLLAQLGDGGFLVGVCRCLIRDIGANRVVIVDTSRAEGRILSLDGHLRGAFGFHEMAEVLARWSEDFRVTLRRSGAAIADGSASGRVAGGKIWVTEVVPRGDGAFYALLAPEKLDEEPIELWLMDQEARVVGRYAFDRTWTGSYAAGFPVVFGVGMMDGGIHEFRAAR